MGAAALFKVPELTIDESEAKTMAAALARVQKHYPILDRIGDKAIDHANLISVLAGVYGTRFMAFNMRRAAERARPTEGDVVVGFPPQSRPVN